jgi:hypothetical protein
MAVVLPNGRQYFEATGGGPAVGYKLYAFVPGTSTPKNTYTTSLGNVPNAHPVVMDARGEAAIYWDGPYDVVLKSANDAVIWGPERLENPADIFAALLADTTSAANGAAIIGRGIQVADSIAALRLLLKASASKYAFVTGYYAAGDGGGGSYCYDAADTTSTDNGGTIIVAADGGRWKLATKNSPISVKQFGAKGNYTGGAIAGQDDTAAIQAAINWAQANVDSVTYGSYSPSVGTGVVYFPQGSYGVNAALTVGIKISILGEGQSEYTYGSRLTQTLANTDLFQITAGAGSTSFSIEKMILRTNTAAGTGHLVNMVRAGGGKVNSQRYIDCTFAQPQAMSLYLGGDDIVIKNCLFDVSSVSGNCIQLGTATQLASHVRIEGADFYNITNSCIKVVNCEGLVVNGNIMDQPNAATKTPYFIDAITTAPTLAKIITVSGNTIRGPRTVFGGNGVIDVTINGNTITEAGIGAGETLDMFTWTGTCVNVGLTGNTLRGSYDTRNFWNDTGSVSVTGNIGDNTFVNNGGAGDAFRSTLKFTGRVSPNYLTGFTNNQLSQKVNSTGAAVNPGNIAAGGTFTYGPITMIGAALGDKVQVGTMSGGWVAAAGIEQLGYCNGANQLTVLYRNSTAGIINVAAHDIWIEGTR